MIGIANQKLWNLGVGLLSKWNGFSLLSFYLLFIVNGGIFTHSIPNRRIFLFYAP